MDLITIIDGARALLNEPLDATRTFPDNTSSFYTDAVLRTYVNMIQDELVSVINQADELYFVTQSYLNIVGGTAEYAIPSGCITLKRVEDNRDPVRPSEILPTGLNQREIQNRFIDASGAISINNYYLRGNQIILTDTPTFTNASAVRLHWVRKLGDLSAGSETSEIPVEHHRLLIWGCVRTAIIQQQGDNPEVTREYLQGKKDLTVYVESRQKQRSRSVRRVKTQGDRL